MKIILISNNASFRMGGEAMKAVQYFDYLLKSGRDVVLLTHSRCRDELQSQYPSDRLLFVEDDAWQEFWWRSVVLRNRLDRHFHRSAARICARFDPKTTVLHYICPISPIEPRFPPDGFDVVFGPLNGNLPYPDGFRHRMNPARRINLALHMGVQRCLRFLRPEKRRVRVILNSGGARTRASLLAAGASMDQIRDVVDAGVSAAFFEGEPVRHSGRNPHFVCVGRLIDCKGIDLALRGLAESDPETTLTILGNGSLLDTLKELAHRLDLGDRVRFAGYVGHDEARAELSQSRALLFPGLSEANGIAVQEAMALGVPVVALNWGGPSSLLSRDSAVLIDPVSEEQVVRELTVAINDLTDNPSRAAQLARKARQRADTDFRWEEVARSWAAAYGQDQPGRP